MVIPDTYIIETDNEASPLSLNEINEHLKESFDSIASNTYIYILVKAIQKFGEQFTKKEFLTKTFSNHRNINSYSCSNGHNLFEIRRSKLVQINSLSFIDKDDSTQLVDSSNYETTISDEFSSLYFKNNYFFPSLSENNPQNIIINFDAGYGADGSFIPNNIKMAMLNHLARLWVARGDCPSQGLTNEFMLKILPETSRLIYSMERIMDVLI